MKLIDADALLKQLGISERFNADVIGVIKGMPEIQPVWEIKFEDDEDDLR